jgi:hypothetical protein
MERWSMRRFELSYHDLAILKIHRSTYIVFSGLATCGDIVSRASSSLGQQGVRKFVVQHVLVGLSLGVERGGTTLLSKTQQAEATVVIRVGEMQRRNGR